jgi:hypothetical protein
VVEDLLKSPNSNAIPVYIYFDYKEVDQTAENVARKLLKQLMFRLDGSHPTIVSLAERQRSQQRPDLPALVKMFTECAKEYTVSVILDAFDECFENQQARLTTLFIKPICEAGINIHITTRDSCLEQLKSVLEGASIEELRADPDDVKNYLDKKITERTDKLIENALKTKLIETISGHANGMFNPYGTSLMN